MSERQTDQHGDGQTGKGRDRHRQKQREQERQNWRHSQGASAVQVVPVLSLDHI